jgi:hypothetical protein
MLGGVPQIVKNAASLLPWPLLGLIFIFTSTQYRTVFFAPYGFIYCFQNDIMGNWQHACLARISAASALHRIGTTLYAI